MKFSIRDLFLVTVIVALVLGWWVDHRRTAAERNEARNDAKLLVDHELNQFLTLPRKRVEEIAKKYEDVPNYFTIRPKPVPDSSAPAPNPPKK